MLAIIRARFPNTAATNTWSDTSMHAWLDPNRPFSLAHFMTRTSFQQLDMRYRLFPPVVVEDRRADPALGESDRERLVRSVLDEVTRMADPDWDLLDQFIICFAGGVDMFGGGMYALKTRPGSDRAAITGAVIDSLSPFDAVCQEVGHAFGLSHELAISGAEYGCPYSPMSAMGQPSSFVRPVDPALPVGSRPAQNGPYNGWSNDVQRIIGCYIPAVHFYLRNPEFAHPDSVYRVPASYEQSPHSFRLDALDRGISAWPQRRRVLAILPSVNNGDEYFLEIRRPIDYDQGLVGAPSSDAGLPAAIVIYSCNAATGRITYVDRIPFSDASGDRDYHSYKGHFAVRLNSVDGDFAGANLTVGGGNFWRHFSADLDVSESADSVSYGDWQTVHTAACFLFGEKAYQFRYRQQATRVSLQATSFGFEKPHHRWFLADLELDPEQTTVDLALEIRRASDGTLLAPASETVRFSYRIVKGHLQLTCATPAAAIALLVKVIVSESATGVLLNVYPDQSVWTNVTFDNVRIEWDAHYNADLARCWEQFTGPRFQETPAFRVPGPEPDPRYRDVSLHDVITQLTNTNPAAANVVIGEVARLSGRSRLDVVTRIGR